MNGIIKAVVACYVGAVACACASTLTSCVCNFSCEARRTKHHAFKAALMLRNLD